MAKVFVSEEEQCQTWLSDTLGTNYTLNDTTFQLDNYLSLEEIHPSIGAMKQLETFYISGSKKIKELPEGICCCTNLKSLIIVGNSLSSNGIPENFRNLINITNLTLSNNKMTYIPEQICDLTNLEYLDLSKNDFSNIENFPDSFTNLTNLNELKLLKVNLSKIPIQIFELTQLRELSMEDDLIKSEDIPQEITNLNLTHLYLSCPFTHIPEPIFDLLTLKCLCLIDNDFSNAEFTDSFSKLTNLKVLKIEKSNLNVFPFHICSISSLMFLRLSYNNISSIPEDISKLSSLKVFDLQHNQISDFSHLMTLTNLKYLNK